MSYDNDDMNEEKINPKDEHDSGIIVNSHLQTMKFLGSEIVGLTFPDYGFLPERVALDNGCDPAQHFIDFLKSWKANSVASFHMLDCGCFVFWSNITCFVSPCRDRHTEPMKDMMANLYDQNPEHYGDSILHNNNLMDIDVNHELLNKLFNIGEQDES